MTISTRGKKLLGKGAFSKVWDNGDDTVLIKSSDYAKEALALWIDSDRFPKLERLDYDTVSTYTMPKYEKTKGIKNKVSAHDWELYKHLRVIMSSAMMGVANIYDGYSKLYTAFEAMPEKFEDERQQLIDALDELSNYGSDIEFEISPRNVFIVDGKILFADCFFFRSQLNQIRAA